MSKNHINVRDTKLDQLTLKQFWLTKSHKCWYSDEMIKVLSIEMLIKKEKQTFPQQAALQQKICSIVSCICFF